MTRTTTTTITTNVQEPAAPLTIRLAVTADAPALRRLAQRDSAPPPEPVSMLVAEVGGELRAALPLDGGLAIALPAHGGARGDAHRATAAASGTNASPREPVPAIDPLPASGARYPRMRRLTSQRTTRG